jgi:hypothetical protein
MSLHQFIFRPKLSESYGLTTSEGVVRIYWTAAFEPENGELWDVRFTDGTSATDLPVRVEVASGSDSAIVTNRLESWNIHQSKWGNLAFEETPEPHIVIFLSVSEGMLLQISTALFNAKLPSIEIGVGPKTLNEPNQSPITADEYGYIWNREESTHIPINTLRLSHVKEAAMSQTAAQEDFKRSPAGLISPRIILTTSFAWNIFCLFIAERAFSATNGVSTRYVVGMLAIIYSTVTVRGLINAKSHWIAEIMGFRRYLHLRTLSGEPTTEAEQKYLSKAYSTLWDLSPEQWVDLVCVLAIVALAVFHL